MTLSSLSGIIVGAVLVYAGVSKLLSWRSWMAAAKRLRVPRPLAAVVPVGEMVVGFGVVVAGSWRDMALLVAAGMLVVFTAILLVHMRSDDRPPCLCFGGASQRPIGARDIVRNFMLLVLVLVAIAS